MTTNWQHNLIVEPRAISRIAAAAHRVAVLGIKPGSQPWQPAFYVPEYLVRAGIDVVPVPVYYPDVRTILGRSVQRDLRAITGPIDIVCVFRRSEHVPMHVDDLIALAPKTVWMQSGIENAEAAERLAKAGIRVVQDHCLMVEHRRGIRLAG